MVDDDFAEVNATMSLIQALKAIDGVEQAVYNETLDVTRVDLVDGAPSDVLSEIKDVLPVGYSPLTPVVDREGNGAVLCERNENVDYLE